MAASAQATFPVFLLLLLSAAIAFVDGSSVDPSGEKFTHVHFYFHETRSGPNTTVANYKNLTSTPSFAYIGVFDNYLREGTDPSSTLLGRAQGVGVFAMPEGRSGLLTATEFVFTAGKYNGSTLTMMGMYAAAGEVDRSIIGGSGRFRMARGYSLSKVISIDDLRLVAKFDLYVKHY
ncbi:unnamed protein product [Musa acuminata subsp. burmannicoides]|uniref:Dirigent protein n=1 Tax=Musa acuminata subsp. malaccensis TaxID=214687 RepID=A0A804JZI6_MUSAM|nr:PREDICTED: dirigent protein 1-like [Musa acuminata subsp. malaccensis]CAG1857681.1 unnamed protein product [Musa acuminata subsp. malaccensis]